MTDYNARAEKYKEQGLISVMGGFDKESVQLFERLKALYGSPNLATAIFNACSNLDFLIQSQIDGWQIELHKPGYVSKRFRLPIH